MIDYPETIDLPSYIAGYEEYCEEIERKNQEDYIDSFTEYDDKQIDEKRIREVFDGKSNI